MTKEVTTTTVVDGAAQSTIEMVPTSIQCEELGCEVLWSVDPLSAECALCQPYVDVSLDILLVMAYVVSPVTAMVVAMTREDSEPTVNLFRLYKYIRESTLSIF